MRRKRQKLCFHERKKLRIKTKKHAVLDLASRKKRMTKSMILLTHSRTKKQHLFVFGRVEWLIHTIRLRH